METDGEDVAEEELMTYGPGGRRCTCRRRTDQDRWNVPDKQNQNLKEKGGGEDLTRNVSGRTSEREKSRAGKEWEREDGEERERANNATD